MKPTRSEITSLDDPSPAPTAAVLTKRSVKLLAYRIGQMLQIVPSIWMLRNPFKIYEYKRVVADAGLKRSDAILDLGCGKGFQTQTLARTCRSATGLDVSENQIANAQQFLRGSAVAPKVTFRCAPVERADLPSGSLDRVFSFCVLEHIPNLEVVLGELRRLLKPDGEIHASVDSLASIKNPALLAQHKRDHHVVQYFTPASVTAQFEAAGLRVFKAFPIMTSEFARREFERRITTADFSHNLLQRVGFDRRLRDGDRASGAAEGIMLVVRARRA